MVAGKGGRVEDEDQMAVGVLLMNVKQSFDEGNDVHVPKKANRHL